MEDQGMLGAVTRRLLDLQRDKMGGAPVEELESGEARLCTLLRQLAVMNKYGIQLTVGKETVYSQHPPNPNTLYSQEGVKLAALLRSVTVDSKILQHLHELGVHHPGELVSHSGTHIISTDDLRRM